MSKHKVAIGIAIALIVLTVFGTWCFGYFTVERPLQQVLASDSRNQGVKATARFDGWVNMHTLVFDVTDVSDNATRMDVFRTFLQYASAMKEKRFTRVVLACRGVKKFTLDGAYFRQLGEEYQTQNPMYTIRDFPLHLRAMDGTEPFSEYSGGVLGVLQKELEQFTEFNDQWYVRDLAASNSSNRPPAESSASPASASEPPVPAAITDDWLLTEARNKMDNTPEVTLSKSGHEGAVLIIRCKARKTDAYVSTNAILDNGSVRIRFDESAPVRQSWGKSTDDEALFAPDAVTFARQLAKTHTFLIEFTPYRKVAQTVSFDVSGLDSKLQKISDACDWASVDRSRAQTKALDAALRARIIPNVHPCKSPLTGWCWSDPDDQPYPGYEEWGGATKEEALQDAMRSARLGVAFKPKK